MSSLPKIVFGFKDWWCWKKAVAVLCLLALFSASLAFAQPKPFNIVDDLDRESLRSAIRQSLRYLEKIPSERVLGEQPRRVTARELIESLLVFEKTLDLWECANCWTDLIREKFEFIPSANSAQDRDVLFTGYFQPVIEGSFTRTREFSYPIYGKPPDLVVAEQVTLFPKLSVEKTIGRLRDDEFVPYPSRDEIDVGGALRDQGYEIAWVRDPVDLFFLHLQGSGILRLADGSLIHLNYAASNGRPYRSIGALLIEQGKIPKEEMSMQRLRRYMAEHPEERNGIMAYNESYVFFRLVNEGPLGSLEVPLTAGRSIATDGGIFPKGALAFVESERPILDASGQLTGWQPFSRFVLNQDTGGAIRGMRRADLYFGTGDEPGSQAGFMNRRGRLYFLMLKSAAGDTAAK